MRVIVAESKCDWQTAKSLLSRVAGEDGFFLLLTLEYSRLRLEWETCEAEDLLGQMKTKYPHPILKQVELDHNYEGAKVTGNPQRIGHHQGLRRAYKRKFGSFWNEPDDFRKAFQIMAAEMRLARNKVWYAHPARARRTELQSHSQHGSNSGLDSRAGLGSETESRSQSQSRHQPQQVDIDQ
ncbi:hypothetical protein PDIG_79700 [Penicillium digitatum PHI26]|uniref:Uncharacterized protein n=2 Tax=Penicillium digitatum TaxID=36651 RepID=K9FDD9_PEND2|nr:hypothetical protein PDIP_28080 [Penicillium digitatum Pd1]EKV06192.1 hypothetical protein PDIG_79700 [Penicillium digitatum PHI26]EKV18260.1 hypothetical protein PDIP_28080 [Penicillium digitatum Pd1]